MPHLGTPQTNKAPHSPSYGSFANTNLKTVVKEDNSYTNNLEENTEAGEENDSGMSSEENDESLRHNLSPTDDSISKNVSTTVDKNEVITKCLIIEPHCAEHGNEIPSCSNYVNHVSVGIENDKYRSNLNADSVVIENKNSDFIVIDLTCDFKDLGKKAKKKRKIGTNERSLECDSSIPSLGEGQNLIPVNSEIALTENQKLLSLSLSILLAALLQAMRCFAQFLEDIVVPQRQ